MSKKCFKMMVLAAAVFSLILTTPAMAKPLRVGIFSDRRTRAEEVIQKTLEKNGMEAEIFKFGRDIDASLLHNYDVVFFGGGWSSYDWLSLDARMHLIELVEQRGGGAIFSMFRCGTVARSMIRPLFPDVADGYNKVNSRGMIIVDPDHPITEGLPGEFFNPYWDHAVMRLGPSGQALAVNTGGEITIACGSAGLGRVVFLGPWIGIDTAGRDAYPMEGHDEKILINSVRWAGGSKNRDRSDSTELSRETKFKVLRRERTIDWTHAERGMSWNPGLLTQARNSREQELDDLAFRLNRYIPVAEQAGKATYMLELQERIARLQSELDANHKQAVKLKQLEISRMSLEELKEAPFPTPRGSDARREKLLDEWRKRLLFQHQLDGLTAEVNEIEKALAPELRKYNQAKFAAARAEDQRNIRNLISELGDSDPAVRANAALELGRIGDTGRRTINELISVLNDDHYDVRKNAIYALSWAQARNAVPALVKLLESHEDIMTRRRAAQALGQIGDTGAVNALVNAIKTNDDAHLQQNAMLALGWIGDKKSSAQIVDIAEEIIEGLEEGRAQHNRLLHSALRSLGYIGNPDALPFLNKLKEDEVLDEVGIVRGVSVDFIGEAKAMIEAGGRGESGVKQLEALSDKNHFYWMTSRYNALFGRYTTWRGEPSNPDTRLNYAAHAGGSGTIEFNTYERWGESQSDMDVDQHMEYATELGLKINTQMPTYPTHANKALYEREITLFGKHPSFGGMWLEENVSLDGWARAEGDEAFRAFLQAKYSEEELTVLGIDDISKTTMPPQPEGRGWRVYERDGARADKVMFAEYLEFAADVGVDNWQETQEFVAGLRKGTKSSFSMSSRYSKGGSTFISGYPRINLALDAAGPQSYGEHSALNNFDLDMHVDGESRPAQGEFYAHQACTPGRVERGFASSFVYGQQFFNWWWSHIFKHVTSVNAGGKSFDPGRWEAAVRQFSKGKAISEYLAPGDTQGAGLLTQLYSGRSTTLTYGDGMIDGYGGGGKIAVQSPTGYVLRYTQNQIAFREAILRSHLPVEMTWLETQHPEKLARWKVAVLADGVSLDAREVEMLREWVRNGGTLVATASSTLHDQWDREQENYSLADVFGVDYVETKGEPCLVYLERDLKPETGIIEITVTAPEYLGLMEGAITAEYEKGTGYDVVKPTTARVVAVWDDETPAVLENQYGKGHAIFIAARYPALSSWTRDWTVGFLYCEFWPGMRELIAGCVRRAFELADTEIPFLVENCPETVDVVLKRQDQNNRWMAHLLNIDENNGLIQNVKATLKPPRPVQTLYYAYPDRSEIEFEQTENGLEFIVRPFDVHEMIVIEWK